MATTNDPAIQLRVEQLMEMGFPEEKWLVNYGRKSYINRLSIHCSRKAVSETGINAEIDTAVNWYLILRKSRIIYSN